MLTKASSRPTEVHDRPAGGRAGAAGGDKVPLQAPLLTNGAPVPPTPFFQSAAYGGWLTPPGAAQPLRPQPLSFADRMAGRLLEL